MQFGIFAWKLYYTKTIIDFMDKKFSLVPVCRSPWQMCLEQIFVTHFDIWPFSFTDYYPKNRSFFKKADKCASMKRWWAKSPIWSFPDGRWRQCDVSSEPFHTWVETEQSKRQPKRRYITSHKDQFSLATKHYSMTKKKAIWDAVAAQVTHHQFYRFDFWNIQGATNLFKMYALGPNVGFLSKIQFV